MASSVLSRRLPKCGLSAKRFASTSRAWLRVALHDQAATDGLLHGVDECDDQLELGIVERHDGLPGCACLLRRSRTSLAARAHRCWIRAHIAHAHGLQLWSAKCWP